MVALKFRIVALFKSTFEKYFDLPYKKLYAYKRTNIWNTRQNGKTDLMEVLTVYNFQCKKDFRKIKHSRKFHNIYIMLLHMYFTIIFSSRYYKSHNSWYK